MPIYEALYGFGLNLQKVMGDIESKHTNIFLGANEVRGKNE